MQNLGDVPWPPQMNMVLPPPPLAQSWVCHWVSSQVGPFLMLDVPNGIFTLLKTSESARITNTTCTYNLKESTSWHFPSWAWLIYVICSATVTGRYHRIGRIPPGTQQLPFMTSQKCTTYKQSSRSLLFPNNSHEEPIPHPKVREAKEDNPQFQKCMNIMIKQC